MATHAQNIKDIFKVKCNCDDCNSGVSPLAYLSSLLDYATQNIKRSPGDVDLNTTFLEDTFHQPFGELSARCETMDHKVSQIRVAVEVLRKYHDSLTSPDSITAALNEYLATAYDQLLRRQGTDSDELKKIQTASLEDQVKLAERLEIDPDNAASLLADLWLDPNSGPSELTEANLEEYFGIQDTTREIFSTGYLSGSDTDTIEFNSWRFLGVQWGLNTDLDGYVYLAFDTSTLGTTNTHKVTAYKDSNRTVTVAYGEVDIDTSVDQKGMIYLVEKNESGLNADIYFDANNAGTLPEATVKVSLVPRFLAMKLTQLYNIFQESTFESPFIDQKPSGVFRSEIAPVLEPDVISHLDLRKPNAGNIAFDILMHRKVWMDDQLEDLLVPSSGNLTVAHMLTTIGQSSINYDAFHASSTIDENIQPIETGTDVESLKQGLDEASTSENTVNLIKSRLRLTVEEFGAFYELYDKYKDKTDLDLEPRVDVRLLADYFALIIKRAFYETWIDEELEVIGGGSPKAAITLNSADFTLAPYTYKEGTWPFDLDNEPYINPLSKELSEYLSPKFSTAHSVYKKRVREVAAGRLLLESYYNTPVEYPASSGTFYNAVLGLYYNFFGAPPKNSSNAAPGDYPTTNSPTEHILNFEEYFDGFKTKLDVTATKDQAVSDLLEFLYITEEEYLMLYNLKVIDDDANQEVNESDLEDVLDILIRVQFEKVYKEDWITKENGIYLKSGRFEYEQVIKQTLSPVRTASQLRTIWEKAYAFRNSTPVIEPEVIGASHIRKTAKEAVSKLSDRMESVFSEAPALSIYEDIKSERESNSGYNVETVALSNITGSLLNVHVGFDLLGDHLYIPDYNSTNIIRYNVADFSFDQTISLPGGITNPENIRVLGISTLGVVHGHNVSVFRLKDNAGSASFELLFKLGKSDDTLGSSDGEFHSPNDCSADSKGNIYVADSSNHRIQKFSVDGEHLLSFGAVGTGDGQFQNPLGVSVNSKDVIHVADHNNDRIQRFDIFGNYVGEITTSMDHPFAISFDHSDRICAATSHSNHLVILDEDGTLLSSYDSGDIGVNVVNSAKTRIDEVGQIIIFDPWYDDTTIRRFDPTKGLYRALNEYTDINAKMYESLVDDLNSEIGIGGFLNYYSLSYIDFEAIKSVIDNVFDNLFTADSDDYWKPFYRCVARCQKNRLYSTWLDEEKTDDLFLTPKDFKIPPEAYEVRSHEAVNDLNLLQRQIEWEKELDLKIKQQRSVALNYSSDTMEIEHTTLQILRDGIVMTTNETGSGETLEEKADFLTKRLLIDMAMKKGQETTRLSQAVEAMQNLFQSVRTDQLMTIDSEDLVSSNDTFHADMKWLSSYESWRSLMFMYIFPENILMPNYRKWQSPVFQKIAQQLQSTNRYSEKEFCSISGQYTEYLKDVGNLQVQASCYGKTKVYDKNSKCSSDVLGGRYKLFTFATSQNSGKPYFSIVDTVENENYNMSLWEEIPGFGSAKTKILQALPMTNIKSAFVAVFVAQQGELKVQKFDLETLKWLEEPVLLELVDGIKNVEELSIENPLKEDILPVVCGRDADGRVYINQVNEDCNDWNQDWEHPYFFTPQIGPIIGFDNVRKYMFTIGKAEDGSPKVKMKALFKAKLNYRPAKEPSTEDAINYKTRNDVIWRFRSPIYDNSLNSKDHLGLALSGKMGSSFKNLQVIKRPTYDDYILTWNTQDDGPRRQLAFSMTPNSKNLTEIANHTVASRAFDTGLIYLGPFQAKEESREDRKLMVTQKSKEGAIRVEEGAYSTHRYYPTGNVRNISPKLVYNHLIGVGMSDDALQNRRSQMKQNFDANQGQPRMNYIYLEEAYFHIPMLVGQHLHRLGQYKEALDWYRTVYNYSIEPDFRKIYYGLIQEENVKNIGYKELDWIMDPTNPHNVAATRVNASTLFTMSNLIRCLLDYADAEYSLDNVESVPRARTLYQTALDLMDSEVLSNQLLTCMDYINKYDKDIPAQYFGQWDTEVKARIRRVKTKESVYNADDQSGTIYEKIGDVFSAGPSATSEDWGNMFKAIIDFANEKKADEEEDKGLIVLKAKQDLDYKRKNKTLLSKTAIRVTAKKLVGFVEKDIDYAAKIIDDSNLDDLKNGTSDIGWMDGSMDNITLNGDQDNDSEDAGYTATSGNKPVPFTAVNIYFSDHEPVAFQQIRTAKLEYIPMAQYEFCLPVNPIFLSLQIKGQANLAKIRSGRNIAGIERTLDPYAAPTDTVSGIPIAGPGGLMSGGGSIRFAATVYRHEVLLNKAKELVSTAQQMENAFLSALEKQEGEYYSILRAKQELKMAKEGVKLQELRVNEAESGIELANLNVERTQLQIAELDGFIQQGLLQIEQDIIDQYRLATDAQKAIAESQRKIQKSSAIISSLNLVSNIVLGATSNSTPAAISAAAAAALQASSVASHAKSIQRSSEDLYDAQLLAQEYGMQANYERQKVQWESQKRMSEFDLQIGAQNVTLAKDRLKISQQEEKISSLQLGHAEATLEYLQTKFTGYELYQWMSNVIQNVYSYFLKEATSMARLAQTQLSFERQALTPGFIQDDYWVVQDPSAAFSGNEGAEVDRRGLTGSSRLLMDITKLSQYAFNSEQNKNELTKTISLAQMAPQALLALKRNGANSFQLPLEVFDRDFPGHYLRLIKNVNVSVIALMPPIEGIKATLTAAGPSNVVVGNIMFQKQRINAPAESIAISSPMNATGRFDLRPDNPRRNPFEGIGVDTNWYFELPKASNNIDYSTIADVIFTVNYTSLSSYNYKSIVLKDQDKLRLKTGSLAISLKDQLPDQWYDLNHPELSTTPMAVTFDLDARMFPQYLSDLAFSSASPAKLYVVAESVDTSNRWIKLQYNDGTLQVGKKDFVTPSDEQSVPINLGVSGNNGTFTLAMPNQAKYRNLFKDGVIEDLVLVIDYEGKTPAFNL